MVHDGFPEPAGLRQHRHCSLRGLDAPARLAAMGFSHEGRYYWLLKTAPVSASQLLAAKFAVAYLPALALGWAFMLVLSWRNTPAWPRRSPAS